MKKLTVVLAILLALSTLLCACSKKPEKSDPGYIINQTNKDDPAKEIAAFYEGNPTALDNIARKLLRVGTYAQYDYYTKMTDYESGTLSFHVQEEVRTPTVTYWKACDNEILMELTKVKYVGKILHDPAIHQDVVLFTPRVSATGKTLALAYCGSESGEDALLRSEFHKNCSVKLTKLAKGWFTVEAVPNT